VGYGYEIEKDCEAFEQKGQARRQGNGKESQDREGEVKSKV